MSLLIDITGLKFNKLTVIKRSGSRSREATWLCRCECGKEVIVRGNSLRKGKTRSCGCLKPKFTDISGLTFGYLTVIEPCNFRKGGLQFFSCKCKCGKIVALSGKTLRSGNTRSCGCMQRERKKGKDSGAWRGGTTRTSGGYILLHKPDHPNAQKGGYIPEHIYIMSENIGRPLLKDETVHHKNGIRNDNRIENLELWATNHARGQRVSDLIAFAKEILITYGELNLP